MQKQGRTVFVAMVSGALVVQALARAITHAVSPQLSAPIGLLVETLAVGVVLAIAAWRMVWLPMARRVQQVALPVTNHAPPTDLVPRRHLHLVD